MILAAGCAGLLAAFGWAGNLNQEPDEIRSLIDQYLSVLPPQERAELADSIRSGIAWSSWGGANERGVVRVLGSHLEMTLGVVRAHEQMFTTLRNGLARTSSAALISFPPEFRERGARIGAQRIKGYVDEGLSGSGPSAAQTELMKKQLLQMEAAVLDEVRRVVIGPYAEETIQGAIQDTIGRLRATLGDVLSGSPNRPLSQTELDGIMERITERAKLLTPAAATRPPDNTTAEPPNYDEDAPPPSPVSPAVANAYALTGELLAWHRFCYPETYRAVDSADKLATEIRDWNSAFMEDLNRALKAEAAEGRKKVAEYEERARKKREADRAKHVRNDEGAAPPNQAAPPAAAPASPGPAPWATYIAIATLLTVAALTLAWLRRRNARTP